MPKYTNAQRATDYPYTMLKEFTSRKLTQRARQNAVNQARNLKHLKQESVIAEYTSLAVGRSYFYGDV